jgi:hypothetical protein
MNEARLTTIEQIDQRQHLFRRQAAIANEHISRVLTRFDYPSQEARAWCTAEVPAAHQWLVAGHALGSVTAWLRPLGQTCPPEALSCRLDPSMSISPPEARNTHDRLPKKRRTTCVVEFINCFSSTSFSLTMLLAHDVIKSPLDRNRTCIPRLGGDVHWRRKTSIVSPYAQAKVGRPGHTLCRLSSPSAGVRPTMTLARRTNGCAICPPGTPCGLVRRGMSVSRHRHARCPSRRLRMRAAAPDLFLLQHRPSGSRLLIFICLFIQNLVGASREITYAYLGFARAMY